MTEATQGLSPCKGRRDAPEHRQRSHLARERICHPLLQKGRKQSFSQLFPNLVLKIQTRQ